MADAVAQMDEDQCSLCRVGFKRLGVKMKAKDYENFGELLDEAEDQATTDAEIDFVSDMRSRYEAYDGETFVSEKQLAWLEKIADL